MSAPGGWRLYMNSNGYLQGRTYYWLRESEIEFICAQTRTRLLVVPSVFRGYDHLAMARSIASRLPGMQVINESHGDGPGERDLDAVRRLRDRSAAH